MSVIGPRPLLVEYLPYYTTQLKEYDADSFAVTIQAVLFLQQWQEDIRVNLANFDKMFIANYLCFRTFAEKTGRKFADYFDKSIDEYDHPHPGIRIYYALMKIYMNKYNDEHVRLLSSVVIGIALVKVITAGISHGVPLCT